MPIQILTRPTLQGDSKVGWLGFVKLGLPGNTVEILELDPEGPAARGGIAVGDRIAQINGRPVEEFLKAGQIEPSKVTVHYLGEEVLNGVPGSEVTFTMKRGDRVWDVKLVAVR